MKKFISIRSLSLIVVLTMLVSLMAIGVAAEATTATLVSNLADGDTVVIYYPAGETTLGTTISGKGVVPADATVAGDSLTVTADMGAFVVEKDEVTNGFYFILNGKYLTSGATGNSMSFEDTASDCALWVLEEAENGFYVKNYAAAYVNGDVVKPQYLEFFNVFTSYSFNSSKANIYTFQFFKLAGEAPEAPSEEPSEEPSTDAPEVVYTDIATVRTAEANEVFNIKGVVTFIDGKNVVVEDETGAINVYLKAAAEVSIGNKVAATGKKGEFNGLKQITSAEIIEVIEENATLPTATEKTIAEVLADVEAETLECHKVIIKNVTLGELNGSNTPITDDAGNSINIYRCPELTITAGTKVDVVAIVSDFKGYQLRIVSADDITVAGEPSDEPSEAPSEEPSEAPSEVPSETPDEPAKPGDSNAIVILAIFGVISLAVVVITAKRHRA